MMSGVYSDQTDGYSRAVFQESEIVGSNLIGGGRRESLNVPVKTCSLAMVMIVVALVAVNLALLRAAPIQMIVIPFPWILLGVVHFFLIWKCVLRRPFRAMHYTFLMVFLVAFVVLANLVDQAGFRLLGLIVGWYQRLNGDQTQSIFLREFVSLGEFWMAALFRLIDRLRGRLACGKGGKRIRLGHRGALAGNADRFWRCKRAHCRRSGDFRSAGAGFAAHVRPVCRSCDQFDRWRTRGTQEAENENRLSPGAD